MVGLSQFYPPCESGDGTGTRTRIVSLKGWCPDRLDDTAICIVRAETHDFWLALATGYLPRVIETVVALPEPSLTIYIISYFL